jgi:sulfur-oxidizing protein SoxY
MQSRRAALRRGMQAGTALLLAGLARRAGAAAQDDPWPALAAQVFAGKPVGDGADVLSIDAPYRAEDAALVPIGLRSLLPAGDVRRIVRITLLIDANPSPLAATLELGPDSGIDRIATRVRINDYTNVHAVAEMADGTLLAVSRFVKAAGGCSAPATTVTAGNVPLGTMRWRLLPAAADDPPGLREAQLMIRHPNNSGMQMDQVTHLYIPAHFIETLRIWQGERRLLAVAGGISLSENPEFRFRFRPVGAAPFRAEARDSKGEVFRAEWPAAAA